MARLQRDQSYKMIEEATDQDVGEVERNQQLKQDMGLQRYSLMRYRSGLQSGCIEEVVQSEHQSIDV